MNIYIDMDDVVADWLAHAQDYLKMTWNKDTERIPQRDWDRLKEDVRFYRSLPLKASAKELIQWCTQYATTHEGVGLYFLTALPHDYSVPYASQDKVWWANEHFPGIPVFFGPFSHDKWRHCKTPQDILIDDRTSNCNEFKSAGGRAHVYRNWEDCKAWLEKELGPL